MKRKASKKKKKKKTTMEGYSIRKKEGKKRTNEARKELRKDKRNAVSLALAGIPRISGIYSSVCASRPVNVKCVCLGEKLRAARRRVMSLPASANRVRAELSPRQHSLSSVPTLSLTITVTSSI